MHVPTSVVNGDDCTFPADTLPIFGGIMVDKEESKRSFEQKKRYR